MRPAYALAVLLPLVGSVAIAQKTDEQSETPALVCGCPSGMKRGDISITTSYLHVKTTKHIFSYGEAIDRGHIRSDVFLLALDYALTDRLALSAGLPYVFSRYKGDFPHPTALDNGTTHGTTQDYRVDLRYNVKAGDFNVTPAVGFVTPSHGYTYFAHAAPGRHLHEQLVSVNVERHLDELVPGMFAQARYGFTFSEKMLNISHNRSNVDVSAGYFILPVLSVRAIWSLQKTHGGIDMLAARRPTGDLYIHHDQISRNDYVNVAIGATYAFSDSLDIFFGALRTIKGRNTHKVDFAPNIGMTWTIPAARWRSHKSCTADPAS